MTRHLVTGSALAFTLAIVGACFSDLPEPVTSSDAGVPDGDAPASCAARYHQACVETETVSTLQCAPSVPSCLRPNRTTCDCDEAIECPSGGDSGCYQPGNSCPAALLAEVPGATCFAFSSNTLPGTAGACLCGCPNCVERCDGEGPLVYFGGADASKPSVPLVGFAIPQPVTTGRLGVYVRARGVGAGISVAIFRGADVLADPQGIASKGSATFSETVVLPTTLTTWTGATAPVQVVLVGSTATAVNLDCVVPFYLPP